MATVKAYSVCKSNGTNTDSAIYSYGPSTALQDGSTLAFDAATPEDAMRTGLSQAYSHGGIASTDANAVYQLQNEGLTPTLINGGTVGAATDLTLDTAGAGNANYPSCTVIVSTTNLNATNTGAGLLVTVTTTAAGIPSTVAVLSAGAGYNAADTDTVGLDAFPGSEVTVTV
jgi:hypothetical protein|tara:strand:- start:2845 stop:3360 length:516 start_codon:yes stop_codon:yes gene_type:complete